MRRIALAFLTLAALAAAAPAADAARRAPVVWATVNVCDSLTHPNEMGIRGSMEGLSRHTRMYMRFRVQFQDRKGRWRMLKSGPLSDSGWQRVGAGRRGEYNAGWNFQFEPPASGGAHVLRGVVRFQWRRGKVVVRRTHAFTEPGHPATAGADPPEFSAEACEIA